MAVSQIAITTPHAERHMQALCAFWGRSLPVTYTPYEGWVPFSPSKVCKIDTDDGILRLRLSIEDDSGLPAFEAMVEDKLREVAGQELAEPFAWLRGTGETIPPFHEEEEGHEEFGAEPDGTLKDWTVRVAGKDVVLTYAEGPGEALLLLHGLGGSSWSFAPIMPALEAAGYRPIAVNMPGYGGSDPLEKRHPSPTELAAHLALVMDEIALQRADILGHSLGGLLAATLAHLHPERVGRMVLSSPPKGFGLGHPDSWPESMTKRVKDLEEEGASVYADKRAAGLGSSLGISAEVHAQLHRQMARLTVPGLNTASSLFAQGDLHAMLKGTSVPHAYIAGGQDRIVPQDVVRHHATLSGATVTLLPDIGHAGYAEDPDAYAKAVLDALATLPACDPIT